MDINTKVNQQAENNDNEQKRELSEREAKN